MTAATLTARKPYDGNGVTTSFPTTFEFLLGSSLVVTLVNDTTGVETVWTLGVEYTVLGGEGSTGSIEVDTVPTDYTPQTGETLVIERVEAYNQATDYQRAGVFGSQTHEAAIDKLTYLAQQNLDKIALSIKAPITTEIGTEYTMSAPEASKVVVGNAGGTGWDHAELSTFGTIDVIEASLLTNDFMVYDTGAWRNKAPAAARSAMGAVSLAGAETVSGAKTLSGLLTLSAALNAAKGANVASASEPDIWGGEDGNLIHITGTTSITDFADAPQAGTSRVVIFDDVLTLTHDAAKIVLPGNANITTAAGDMALIVADTTSLFKVMYFRADGKAVNPASIVSQTAVASTSGTTIDFTSIPAGVQRIILTLAGVSTDGTSDVIVQIGDSGGVETTGYSGNSVNSSQANGTGNSVGFITENLGGASTLIDGRVELQLLDPATNLWVCSGIVCDDNAGTASVLVGTKTLSGELDRVRLTSVSADDFDAGSVNISYES